MSENIVDTRLKDIEHIDVAPNEIFIHATINRNIERLLSNDLQLNKIKNSIPKNVLAYDSSMTYDKNDFIWFKAESSTGKSTWFILKSLINNNMHKPEMELKDGIITFEKSGWQDINEYTSLIDNNLSGYITETIVNNININHSFIDDYHKYNELSSTAQLETKILKKDMSNIDKDREYLHYPYETKRLEENNVIQSGFYRKWDCGILEYDIIFKLGFINDKQTINGISFDIVECNNLVLDDSDYFMDENAKNIFNQQSPTKNSIIINNVIETNHIPYVNSYSGQIDFPCKFIDTNYMIFGSDIRRQKFESDDNTIDVGHNTITYVNKKVDSICPLYIAYQDENINDNKHGIITNNFHCQIIGRWK